MTWLESAGSSWMNLARPGYIHAKPPPGFYVFSRDTLLSVTTFKLSSIDYCMHGLIYAKVFHPEWCEVHKRQPLAGCLACWQALWHLNSIIVEQLVGRNGVGLCFCKHNVQQPSLNPSAQAASQYPHASYRMWNCNGKHLIDTQNQ